MYECIICKKIYKSNLGFNKHKCNKEKKCEKCGKFFKRNIIKKNHEKICKYDKINMKEEEIVDYGNENIDFLSQTLIKEIFSDVLNLNELFILIHLSGKYDKYKNVWFENGYYFIKEEGKINKYKENNSIMRKKISIKYIEKLKKLQEKVKNEECKINLEKIENESKNIKNCILAYIKNNEKELEDWIKF